MNISQWEIRFFSGSLKCEVNTVTFLWSSPKGATKWCLPAHMTRSRACSSSASMTSLLSLSSISELASDISEASTGVHEGVLLLLPLLLLGVVPCLEEEETWLLFEILEPPSNNSDVHLEHLFHHWFTNGLLNFFLTINQSVKQIRFRNLIFYPLKIKLLSFLCSKPKVTNTKFIIGLGVQVRPGRHV